MLIAPRTALAAPQAKSVQPQAAGTPRTTSRVRSRPYAPHFSITPESRAETWLGATGRPAGRQAGHGARPILVPKPAKASTSSAGDTVGGNEVAAPGIRNVPIAHPMSAQKAKRHAS